MTASTSDVGAAEAATAATAPAAADSEEKLPVRLLLGWGIGALSMGIILNGQFILIQFMTDYLGIAAAAAGAVIGLSKLYDLVTDPVMGAISDNTKTRYGRRRPWLLVGATVAALAFGLIYTAPFDGDPTASLWFAGAALFLLATGYTIFNVPFLAMPAEMTTGYSERTRILSFRTGFAGVSMIFAGLAPALVDVFGGGVAGFTAMGWTLAAIIFVTGISAFFGSAKARATEKTTGVDIPFMQQAKLALSNKPLAVLLASKLCQLLSLSAASACLIFFITRVLERGYAFLSATTVVNAVLIIFSMPIWVWVSKRIGKRNAYMVAILSLACIYMTWLLSSAAEPDAVVLGRMVILGFFSAGVILFGPSMLPDTMEYDYLRTGLRREGIFAAFYTTMEKAAFAFGGTLIAAFLSWRGYLPSTGGKIVEQPDTAIQAIYLGVSVIPAILLTCGALLLLLYDLDADKLKAMRAEKERADNVA